MPASADSMQTFALPFTPFWYMQGVCIHIDRRRCCQNWRCLQYLLRRNRVHNYIECTYTHITLDCITLHCITLHYSTMPVALGPTNLGLLNEQLHQALELVLVSCNIKSARGQLEFTSLSSLALWGARCNLSVKKRNIRGQHNVRTLLLLVPK